MANETFPPNLAQTVKQQNTFSTREVGVTHPDNPAYIRLTDSGDIHIMVSDALGIIINREHNSITLMANTIRFMTTDSEGLGWNGNFFNANATVYTQPTLNPATGANVHNVFSGAENYYNTPATASTTSIAGDQVSGSIVTNAPSQDLATSVAITSGNAVQVNDLPPNPNTQILPG